MPFCPMCQSEYRQGFSRCSDCDASLVEVLQPPTPPTPSPPEPEALVTVGMFSNPALASLLASELETEGIQTFVEDSEAISMDPLLAPALGGVKVRVRSSDAEKGLEIARQSAGKPLNDPTELEIPCPACKSPLTHQERFSTRMAFLFILLLGFPLLFRKGGRKCMTCGHVWKPYPSEASPLGSPKEPC
jgi:hypothetical protein